MDYQSLESLHNRWIENEIWRRNLILADAAKKLKVAKKFQIIYKYKLRRIIKIELKQLKKIDELYYEYGSSKEKNMRSLTS